MAVTVVVGAQWGDEGKGRIVDWLAQRADVVIRFQGGDNAGHTVVNDHGKFALHMVPSGIFNPDTLCVVGAGTVVNPENLLVELAGVEQAGVPTDNLVLSQRAHLVLSYSPQLDGLEEASRKGASVIGTTKRGIGPTYSDKTARFGLRLGDILHPDYLRERLDQVLPRKNRQLGWFGQPPVEVEAVMEQAARWREQLGHRIVDTLPLVREAVSGGKQVLLEGQLGVMRDLDWGIYPYVTSSNPIAGAAASGAGLPPTAIDEVIGVVKVYSTAVGAGPFPVELHDADGDRLTEVGHEYGATTGRRRRCGWFDGVAIRHATWLNGFTALAMTKLDVLDGFEQIKVCVGYQLPDGTVLDTFPAAIPTLREVTPIWETWPGWMSSTRDARSFDQLPVQAQRYLRRLEELAGAPMRFISVGPERDRLIVMD